MNKNELFILKINQDNDIFKNRAIKFGSFDEFGMYSEEIISTIPDDLILRDSCNNKIETDEIMLLMLDSDTIWEQFVQTVMKNTIKI